MLEKLPFVGGRASSVKHKGFTLPTGALYEEAIFRNEGHLTAGGAFIVNTGQHTARAEAAQPS